MGTDQPIDQLIKTVAGMDREQCVAHLRRFHKPRLDFTDDYLARLTLDQLRHVLMAACLQANKGRRSA